MPGRLLSSPSGERSLLVGRPRLVGCLRAACGPRSAVDAAVGADGRPVPVESPRRRLPSPVSRRSRACSRSALRWYP